MHESETGGLVIEFEPILPLYAEIWFGKFLQCCCFYAFFLHKSSYLDTRRPSVSHHTNYLMILAKLLFSRAHLSLSILTLSRNRKSLSNWPVLSTMKMK